MAGEAIGLFDDLYKRVGATILPSADEVFAVADMMLKVKEPQPAEIQRLRKRPDAFTICIWRPIASDQSPSGIRRDRHRL